MKHIALLLLVGVLASCVSSAASTDEVSAERAACMSAGGPVDLTTVVRDTAEVAALFTSLLQLTGSPDTMWLTIYDRYPAPEFIVGDSAELPVRTRVTFRRVMESALLGSQSPEPPIYLAAWVGPDSSTQVAAETIAICRPELINRDEVARALRQAQAQLMRNAHVVLNIFIDEAGIPYQIDVATSSGDPTMDAVAVSIGYITRYRPALNRGRPMRVIAQQPITFVAPGR